MSLPDLLKDVKTSANSHSNSKQPMESCKPKSLSSMSSTIRSRESSSPDFEWETDSHSSVDEGEAAWDALGRMNSIRRSNRFDKPQLLTVQLQRTAEDGFGLELGGKSPPVIHAVSGEAETKGIRQGDRVLEVNGVCVRDSTHQEAGRLVSGSDSLILLVHTVKPPIQPSGKVVYTGWVYKKGGSGITPRNWRRRWFVLRDDCIAYYYPSSEDVRPLGAIVMHNYTISKCGGDAKKPYSFKIMKGGARTYFLASDSEAEMNQWAQVLTEAANLENREQVHITGSARNVSVSALSIKSPERHGVLYKQGRGFLSWKRTYCVLKCQQMFFYANMSQTTAQEVLNIQGYELVTRKSKDKHYYFDAVPPTKERKVVHFYTETEFDRTRWMETISKSVEGPTPVEGSTCSSIDSS